MLSLLSISIFFHLLITSFSLSLRTRLRLHTLDNAHLHEGSDMLMESNCCPFFMSPEILQPGNYSGQAADLWSLSIILYTHLAGHYPFSDTSLPHLFAKIQSGYYTMLENVSWLGRLIISSLLAYDPSHRIPAKVILHHPWFEKNSFSPPPPTDQPAERAGDDHSSPG